MIDTVPIGLLLRDSRSSSTHRQVINMW